MIDNTQYILNEANIDYDTIHFPIGRYNNRVMANFK